MFSDAADPLHATSMAACSLAHPRVCEAASRLQAPAQRGRDGLRPRYVATPTHRRYFGGYLGEKIVYF